MLVESVLTMKNNFLQKKPVTRTAYFIILTYIFAGALGAGYFDTRSFLALNALLCMAALRYVWRSGSLKLLPLHSFLLLFTLLYWLSFVWAVDLEEALLEAAKISSLLPLSLLYAEMSRDERGKVWSAWAWCGTFLTLWGLAFGLFREGRLESTLGYANVFAVIAAAGAAAGWFAYNRSGHKRYLAASVIQLGGLLLSGSRAVLILTVIGACLYLVTGRVSMKSGSLKKHTAAMIAAVVLLVILSYATVQLRGIAWNTPEFALRRIYWTDAYSVWRQHWLLGTGGGGWAVLYPSVFVKYVHQQYLQVALDTGIVGLLSFIGIIVCAVRAGLNQGRRGWAGILAVFLFCAHLAFDIDLAYPLVFGLFIMLLTGMEAEGGAGKEIYISGSVRTVLAVPLIIAAIAFTWLTAGYVQLERGVKGLAGQEWVKAERSLTAAQSMLPWSHTVHYRLAELYSGIASSGGQKIFIDRAIVELQTASKMIPENRSYKQLLKQAEANEK